MARPIEIPDDRILAVGRKLVEEGQAVTGWSLRRALDDHGKPDRLFAVWERGQAEDPHDELQGAPATTVLPPGVAEAADQARQEIIARFDGILFSIFRTTDETLKSRYKADFDRLTTERAAMTDQLAAAAESVEVTEGRLAESEGAQDELRSKLAETETAAAVTAERLRSIEASSTADAEKTRVEIATMAHEIAQAGAAVQQADRAMATAEATAAAAEREANRLRAQVETLVTDLTASRSDFARLQVDVATTVGAVKAATERAEGLSSDLAEARSTLATTAKDLVGLQVDVATAKGETRTALERAEARTFELSRVQAEVERLRTQALSPAPAPKSVEEASGRN